ncbi:hypothetical protein MMC29_003201 [Sticta canariensis]|nr:hypothetical protein [Sticta canariensis]
MNDSRIRFLLLASSGSSLSQQLGTEEVPIAAGSSSPHNDPALDEDSPLVNSSKMRGHAQHNSLQSAGQRKDLHLQNAHERREGALTSSSGPGLAQPAFRQNAQQLGTEQRESIGQPAALQVSQEDLADKHGNADLIARQAPAQSAGTYQQSHRGLLQRNSAHQGCIQLDSVVQHRLRLYIDQHDYCRAASEAAQSHPSQSSYGSDDHGFSRGTEVSALPQPQTDNGKQATSEIEQRPLSAVTKDSISSSTSSSTSRSSSATSRSQSSSLTSSHAGINASVPGPYGDVIVAYQLPAHAGGMTLGIHLPGLPGWSCKICLLSLEAPHVLLTPFHDQELAVLPSGDAAEDKIKSSSQDLPNTNASSFQSSSAKGSSSTESSEDEMLQAAADDGLPAGQHVAGREQAADPSSSSASPSAASGSSSSPSASSQGDDESSSLPAAPSRNAQFAGQAAQGAAFAPVHAQPAAHKRQAATDAEQQLLQQRHSSPSTSSDSADSASADSSGPASSSASFQSSASGSSTTSASSESDPESELQPGAVGAHAHVPGVLDLLKKRPKGSKACLRPIWSAGKIDIVLLWSDSDLNKLSSEEKHKLALAAVAMQDEHANPTTPAADHPAQAERNSLERPAEDASTQAMSEQHPILSSGTSAQAPLPMSWYSMALIQACKPVQEGQADKESLLSGRAEASIVQKDPRIDDGGEVLPPASSFGDVQSFRQAVAKAVKDAVLRQLAHQGSPAVSNIYSKSPKPSWWPLPDWNAAQVKKGKVVLERIWTALPQSHA